MENVERLVKVEESVKSAHHRLNEHDTRLDKGEEKIDMLCSESAVNTGAIKNLCEKIEGLIGTIKWFIGLAITLILGIAGILVSVLVRG
jgi:tetrahydromethanopterin S-methyltransferase subunit G